MTDLSDLVEACRDWVDSSFDDATILSALARNDNDPQKASLSLLRRRRVELTTSPQTFAIAGDASWSADSQIKLLDDLITQLERRTGDTAGAQQPVTLVPLVPPRDLHRGRDHLFPNLR